MEAIIFFGGYVLMWIFTCMCGNVWFPRNGSLGSILGCIMGIYTISVITSIYSWIMSHEQEDKEQDEYEELIREEERQRRELEEEWARKNIKIHKDIADRTFRVNLDRTNINIFINNYGHEMLTKVLKIDVGNTDTVDFDDGSTYTVKNLDNSTFEFKECG